ncbi:DUF7282 domain-containing protein [Halorientalis salina]|uniref:DUF7282 domain-containing protein n=1 Tax=Halorientalis salina TaxID=2932266 RepID=UPI0010ABB255|nr:BGTF surface domain-containing protein [Halorientalis salina]
MTWTRAAIRRLALLGVLVALAVGLFVPTGGATAPDTVNQSANESANESVEMTAWVAPAAQFDSFDTSRDVHAAMENGTLTRTRTRSTRYLDGPVIADQDVLVLALESPGAVETVRHAREGNQTATGAFADLVTDSNGSEFTMVQTNPTASFHAKRMNRSGTAAADALRVVPDERNGTLYLFVATERAVFERESDPEMTADRGDVFNATLVLDDPGLGASTEWGVVERTLEFEEPVHGDRLVFGVNAPCHRLAGRTSVAPGTELAIRMVASAEYRPLETTAVVDPDGTFATTLDTSEPYPSNESVDVTVSGVQPDITEGVFGHDGGPVGLTSVWVDDQQSNGSAVVVERTTIGSGKGGFVALYPASVADDIATTKESRGCGLTQINRSLASEHILGVSEYLVPGEHEDVTIRLDAPLDENRTLVAVPHLDTNGNETFDFPVSDSDVRQSALVTTDRPATLNGSLVRNRASVTVDSHNETTTLEPTATATVTPNTSTATTESNTTTAPTTGTTTGDGPGFTPVVATLAVLAVALLCSRQRRQRR